MTPPPNAKEAAELHPDQTDSLLKMMLESMPDLVWLKDVDGVYLACNRAFANSLGTSVAEVIGKTDLDFFDDVALTDSFRGNDRRAMRAGTTSANDEWVTFADDGHRALVETLKTPMFDEAGRLIGILGIAREVTELRAAQEALERQVALLTGLSDATDRILSVRALTNESIADALQALGLATSSDRAYVFEHHHGENGSRGTYSQLYEWCREGIEPQIDNPSLQDRPWDEVAPRWYDTFIAGGHIAGDVADFPDEERAVLEPQNVVSVLALPIEADSGLWGFIGFDVCSGRRRWSPAEVLSIQASANSLVVAIGRMRAEAALRESEENFRTFFDTVDDMVVVGSPDGRIIYANPAVSTKLGYSPGELSTMQVLDLNDSDRRAEATAILTAMFNGERDSCPLPLETKSGALVPAETRVWFGRWNGADCIFGVSKDLTAEQEALQKFDQLFQRNPAPMAVSEMPSEGFSDVNDAFVKALGYSREEIIGKTSADLGLFVQPKQQQELARQLSTLGRIQDCELQVKRKDGTLLDGLFSGEVIFSQGTELFLTVMLDITDRKQAEEAQHTLASMIAVIGRVSEIRDPYMAGHQRRVAQLASAIASDLGMPEAEIANIRMAGLMIDIGKISVPAEILSKPATLTSMEFKLLQGHAEAGYEIIASAHMHGFIAEFVRQHHERLDGSGYPHGLTGDEMLPGSKVLAVADVVEAMMSHRPHRAALGQDAALAEIEQGAGRLYDVQAVESCLRLFREEGFEFSDE